MIIIEINLVIYQIVEHFDILDNDTSLYKIHLNKYYHF